MEMRKTGAPADGKPIHSPMEKDKPFPTACKQVSHSSAYLPVYAHSHNACYGENPPYPFLSIIQEDHYG